jgi:hypothetical protein
LVIVMEFFIVKIRSAAIMALLAALTWSEAGAQGSVVDPSSVSPYTQSRSQAYTSFDNPYAQGKIYDPYRFSRALNGSQVPAGKKQGLGLKDKLAGLSQPKRMAGLHDSDFSIASGNSSRASAGCMSDKSRITGNSGLGMNPGATTGPAGMGSAGGRYSPSACGGHGQAGFGSGTSGLGSGSGFAAKGPGSGFGGKGSGISMQNRQSVSR